MNTAWAPMDTSSDNRALKRDEPHDDKKVSPRNKKPRKKKPNPNPNGMQNGVPAPGQPMVNLPPSQIPPVHTKAVSPLITHGHPYSPVRNAFPSFPGNPQGQFPPGGHFRPRGESPRAVIVNRPMPGQQRPQMTPMRVLSNGAIIDQSQIVTQIPVVPFPNNQTPQSVPSPQNTTQAQSLSIESAMANQMPSSPSSGGKSPHMAPQARIKISNHYFGLDIQYLDRKAIKPEVNNVGL